MNISGAKSLVVRKGVTPKEIIEAMGGPPTEMWQDDVQQNLEYEFESHTVVFCFMFGEFSDVELKVEGDFEFSPKGSTFEEIEAEVERFKGRWKPPAK